MHLFKFGSKVLYLLSTSKKSTISTGLLFGLVFASMALRSYAVNYYSTSDNDIAADFLNDYTDSFVRTLYNNRKRLSPSRRRGCIRRGATCDHRPNDCCYSALCRCNLWGTNCRCKRMGLFQRWG